MRPRKTWVFLTENEWSLVFINLVPRVGKGLSSTGEDDKRAGVSIVNIVENHLKHSIVERILVFKR